MQKQYEIPEELHEHLPGYVERRQQDLEAMQASFQSKDWLDIQRVAHKIKGSGAPFGFPRLSEIAKNIEESATEKDAQKAEEYINQLLEEVKNIENYVEKKLDA